MKARIKIPKGQRRKLTRNDGKWVLRKRDGSRFTRSDFEKR